MKKVLLATTLALTAGVASAANLTITGGNWASVTTWNNNADASLNNTFIYDNPDAIPPVLLSGAPSAFTWNNDAGVAQNPAPFTGTYSGSLVVDDVTGEVTGGSLVITGRIGDQVVVGTNSWWLRIWTNVNINLGTGSSTVGATECYRTLFAPANCSPGVLAGMPGAFNISAGAPTPGACYLPGATNDPANDPNSLAPACGPDGPAQFKASWNAGTNTLSLFKEGRSASGNVNGTDLLYQFTLSTTSAVIPVPAAVWLFGSALGLLGWVRRRAA